ncbi:MAG: glycosyltransferase family 2 protein [Bacteroides sp.]
MILSIVVPCYNETEVLHETSARLTNLLNRLVDAGKVSPNSFVLFVNDGSRDNTWELIKELYRDNKHVYGLNLAGNVGHQNALMAGLMTAKEMSDIIISIDADLQDDVEVIEQMVDKYSEGFDIVYGVRSSRKTDTFFKRNSALAFYKLMKGLGVNSVYNHADYRLMSKRAVEQLSCFKERNLFLRGIVPLIGYNTTSVYYERSERFAGDSKYPIRKMINFAIDGITSFSVKPVRMIAATGLIILFLSLLGFIYVLYVLFTGGAVAGWASTILSIWFIGSIILISIGVVGEYIGKIYIEVKERPRYNIETLLCHKDEKND